MTSPPAVPRRLQFCTLPLPKTIAAQWTRQSKRSGTLPLPLKLILPFLHLLMLLLCCSASCRFLSFAVYLFCVVLCLRINPYIYEIQLLDFIRILIFPSRIPYIPPPTKFITLFFQMLNYSSPYNTLITQLHRETTTVNLIKCI